MLPLGLLFLVVFVIGFVVVAVYLSRSQQQGDNLASPEARLEKRAKKKKVAADSQDAGIRDLILEGRMEEAVEVYQKFAGVDAYTARDAVDEIAHDLHQSATEGLSVTDQLRQNKR